MIAIHFLLAACFLAILSHAIHVDTSSKSSVCSAASLIVDNALTYYSGGGVFASPSYWWMYGTTFASLLNFQHICHNSTYQDLVYKGILAHVGSNFDFQPSSYIDSIGNDDIGTWALAAIQAGEMGFKDPSTDSYPSWVEIAENAFDVLYDRWDSNTCNGGLRWQFHTWRTGYDYKALIANANLFQLAARLAKYTGDQKYVEYAESIYEWIYGTGLINDLEYGSEVYDGFDASTNCTDTTKVMWTYNYGVLIAGSGYMYNITHDEDWLTRMDNILLGSQALYNNTILYERACESFSSCNTDQTIFKSIYARYIGLAGKLVGSVSSRVQSLLLPAAKAAAASCSGGSSGTSCGLTWSSSAYDGNTGLGQQMNALEVLLNSIV